MRNSLIELRQNLSYLLTFIQFNRPLMIINMKGVKDHVAQNDNYIHLNNSDDSCKQPQLCPGTSSALLRPHGRFSTLIHCSYARPGCVAQQPDCGGSRSNVQGRLGDVE